jgi:CHASE3 domain sensor protein
MDPFSAEDSWIIKAGCALALVTICLALGFHYAFNRTLSTVDASVTGGFLVVDHVDAIVDDLDRLTLNQRAFLGTGDERFSQDVVESVMGIERNLDSLAQLKNHGPRLRLDFTRLEQAVGWALDSLGKSNDLNQSMGSGIAIALLDNDDSIADAKSVAQQLRKEVTDGVFNRFRKQRKMRTILDVLF